MNVVLSQANQLPLEHTNKVFQSQKHYSQTDIEKILRSSYYIKLLKEKRNSRSQTISQPQGKIINQKMRNRVVKWLKQISQETFQFNNLTLYHAIQILDEYLLISNQHYTQLQLIASACLFISSKIEQRIIVAAQCYVECADSIFTKEALEQKQLLIFETLGFNICFPHPIKMIHAIVKISKLNIDSLKEGQQFLIQSLINNHNVGHYYLDIASAVILAIIDREISQQIISKKLNQLLLI